MDWNDRLVRSRRVAARTIGSETFIVSPSDSTLHLLPNEVASRIWELADGSRALREIHWQICQEYDVDPTAAESDLREFAEALLSRGLASLNPGAAGTGGGIPAGG